MNLFAINDKCNLDELVFENRNRTYGAYTLRKTYPANLNKALLGSLSSLLFLFILSGIFKTRNPFPIAPPASSDKWDTVEVVLPPTEEKKAAGTKTPSESPQGAASSVNRNLQMQVVSDKQTADSLNAHQTHTETKISGNNTTAASGTAGSHTNGENVMVTDLNLLEVWPAFPGGEEALMNFLGANLNYPPMAIEASKQGTSLISFTVTTDGSIKDVRIESEMGYGCDEEAERVVKLMPRWKPGMQNNRAVMVRFVLPVQFSIDE